MTICRRSTHSHAVRLATCCPAPSLVTPGATAPVLAGCPLLCWWVPFPPRLMPPQMQAATGCCSAGAAAWAIGRRSACQEPQPGSAGRRWKEFLSASGRKASRECCGHWREDSYDYTACCRIHPWGFGPLLRRSQRRPTTEALHLRAAIRSCGSQHQRVGAADLLVRKLYGLRKDSRQVADSPRLDAALQCRVPLSSQLHSRGAQTPPAVTSCNSQAAGCGVEAHTAVSAEGNRFCWVLRVMVLKEQEFLREKHLPSSKSVQ